MVMAMLMKAIDIASQSYLVGRKGIGILIRVVSSRAVGIPQTPVLLTPVPSPSLMKTLLLLAPEFRDHESVLGDLARLPELYVAEANLADSSWWSARWGLACQRLVMPMRRCDGIVRA